MSTPNIDFSNRNSLWCGILAETLVRCGVREVVSSPGSRSTPLTFACVRNPRLDVIPVLDERSAAFFALGLAKRSKRPVALICTSGTAAANYLPSIIEAQASGVPLLVFTADRPPEMRACCSGQTIDQQKLYGSYVAYQHEYAVPEPDPALLRYVRQTTSHAVERSLHPFPGPVHLNCPFRDPLHPAPTENLDSLRDLVLAPSFWEHLLPHEPPGAGRFAEAWAPPAEGILVAGPSNDFSPAHAEATARLARRLGWPVLADALSPMRHYTGVLPALVSHYDALLRSPKLAAALEPRAVLVVDGLPTSKVLRSWLGNLPEADLLYLSLHPENRDPLHALSRTLRGDLQSLLGVLGHGDAAPAPQADLWARANEAARAHVDAALESETGLIEPKAAWLLPRILPAHTPVFVANSMPVRDFEYTWAGGDRKPVVFFNRGANGIDGTLSTAVGIAQGGQPAVLVTGDLSLLHDSNGLLLHRHLRGSLTILLINNEGGGIFEHLPVSAYNPPFEEYFATPQKVDFAALAAAHGLVHERITSWKQLTERLSSLPSAGIRILELPTDRRADAALRKRLFPAAAQAAEQVLG